IDIADMQGRPDIARLDEAVIDAEAEDQRHLGDEENAEEEGEAAQAFLAAPLEGEEINLINRGAEDEEGGGHQQRREDRIESKALVEDICAERAEDDERGMGEVADIEHAEGDGE